MLHISGMGINQDILTRALKNTVRYLQNKIQFDKAPKMKAVEIADKVEELLRSGKYDFGRLNFANGDMVGHTAITEAVVTAVETVDKCVERLLGVIEEMGGIAIITADHGNADEMYTEKKGKKSPKTAHTLNPVPFIIFDPKYKGEYKIADLDKKGLSNVAANNIKSVGI